MSRKTRSVWTYFTFCVFVFAACAGFVWIWRAVEHNENRIQSLEHSRRALLGYTLSETHGMAIFDEHRDVKLWNPAMEKWTGYTAKEMAGKDLSNIVSDRWSAEYLEKCAEAMDTSTVNGHTIRLEYAELVPKDPDADPVPVTISVRGQKTADKTEERYAIVQVDLTEKVIQVEPPVIMEGAPE